MNHPILPILLGAMAAVPTGAQQPLPPAPGDRAPELQLAAVISDADPLDQPLAARRGKVVVLEFWTTWCGACLASAPHWNALVDELSAGDDPDFVFIAITNEERATVERCLDRVPRRGMIALDDADQTFGSYDPGGVPHVVVVDRQGDIAAVTHATALNADDLHAIARGEPHSLPHKTPRPRRTTTVSQEPPTERRTVVEAADTAGNQMRIDNGRFESMGLPLRIVLRSVFELPKGQIAVDLPDADEPFDITIEAPGVPRDQIKEYARAELLRELQLVVEHRTEEQDVVVLQRIDGAPQLTPSQADAPEYSVRGMQLHCVKQPLARLRSHMSRLSGGTPVFDETGLGEEYDYDLEVFDKESLVAALRDMGLEYAKDRRDVRVTVLRRADATSR
ncbi:MAG: TIGR03435 family protein [Planctomycetota bacterium]